MIKDSPSRRLSPEQIAALPDAQRKAYLSLFIENNRGRPQIRNAPRLGGVTAKIVRPLSKKFGPGTQALKRQWPQIVGEKYARLSRPGRLHGSKYGRTLTIEAQGPAAALINADCANIMARINRFLGDGYISRLKFVQTGRNFTAPQSTLATQERKGLMPGQEGRLQKVLADMPASDLKSALNELGRGVYARDHKGLK